LLLILHSEHYKGDKMKEDEMGGCLERAKDEKYRQYFIRKPEGKPRRR